MGTKNWRARIRHAVDFIFNAKQKFGNRFEYSNVVYTTSNDDIKIECPIHGIFVTTPRRHITTISGGCSECAVKLNELHNKKQAKKYWESLNGIKCCNRCLEKKDLSEFKKWNTNRGIRISAYCNECRKAIDREKSKGRDKDKSKAAVKKYQEKKRIKRIERNQPKSKVYIRRCKDCGQYDVLRYVPKGIGVDYCKKHQAKHKTKGKTLKIVEMESVCPDCGRNHMAKKKVARCACCAGKAVKMLRKKHKKKRRALLKGAKYGIAFADKDIFKRDKWKCKLCGCKVQKKDIYANNAAEIDHIIPLSKGGPHTPGNVQTLCRECNQKKSDKLIGQIGLFSALHMSR